MITRNKSNLQADMGYQDEVAINSSAMNIDGKQNGGVISILEGTQGGQEDELRSILSHYDSKLYCWGFLLKKGIQL